MRAVFAFCLCFILCLLRSNRNSDKVVLADTVTFMFHPLDLNNTFHYGIRQFQLLDGDKHSARFKYSVTTTRDNEISNFRKFLVNVNIINII